MSSSPNDQIEKDRQDVEEFNRRLLEKDTQKSSSNSLDTVDDASKRLTAQQKRELVPELRELSRQVYLEKRQKKQIELLQRELEDEQMVFDEHDLTENEQKDREQKRVAFRRVDNPQRVLELATKRKHVDDELPVYVMPTSGQVEIVLINNVQMVDGHEVLNRDMKGIEQRYVPEKKRESDQDGWERNQIEMTKHQAGAEDRHVQGSDYEMVPIDDIEFVESLVQQGYNIEQLLAENKARDEALSHAQSEFEKIQIQRASLPVARCREQILEYVAKYNIIIVEAETGSGKTTQIPQFLYEAGYCKKGMIGCTQPRRVACMEVSARVAKEMGVKLGNEVGYSVRFENKTNDRTVIKYLTDGMLLREFLTEPDLSSYSVMMIDEAHERSLHTDILLGLIKDVSRARDDLKIIISSATMDSEKFSNFFDEAPILSVGVSCIY